MPNRKRNRPGSLTIGDYHWKLCDDGRYMMCDGHVGDRYQCGETESLLVEMLYRCEQEKAEILNRSARDEKGLAVTCPASRHAEQIAEELIKHGSCGQLADEGKHAGQSILSAVRSLYAARAEIARLVAEVERHRMTPEERRMSASAADFMSHPGIDPERLAMSAEINVILDYLARTRPQEPSNG